MNQQLERVFEFGPFRIDAVKRLLSREGETIPVTSKCLDTLLVLVEHPGEIVSKDDLMKRLWPDTVVEENNLTQQISLLRKALGERANEHRYVVTIPGRGYSFVAEVNTPHSGDMDLIVEEHIRSRITVDVDGEHETPLLSPKEEFKYLPSRVALGAGRWGSRSTIVSLAALLVGLTLFCVWFFSNRNKTPGNGARKVIAVLPFKPINSDPTNDYLSTGMADALIAKLSNVQEISVRPTSAIIRYAGQPQDAHAIGRELGVDSVLEGTVQSAGERIRVTVQLVSVQDQNPLWAKSFDEKVTDILTLQDTISEQVAQNLMVKLNGDEQNRIKKRDTENVEAYQEYLRGRYFWNQRTEDGLTRSLHHFQHAINLDSHYAQAYAGLADAYTLLVSYRISAVAPDEGVRKAREAANTALGIDEKVAEAHASLAMIRSRYDDDHSGAEVEFKRAIELNPSYATGHHWYSEYLALRGRETEAMAEIKQAQELDPLSSVINTTVGERLYFARRYDEAIEQLRKTLEIAPDFASAHFVLGLALEQRGFLAEAISELQKAKGTGAGRPSVVASLAHAYALAGQKKKARTILRVLITNGTAGPYEIGMVYQGLGDKQQSIYWLTKTKDRRGELLMMLRLDPRLDSLRSDPGFRELL